jgi:hypothetical protein
MYIYVKIEINDKSLHIMKNGSKQSQPILLSIFYDIYLYIKWIHFILSNSIGWINFFRNN